ncbi:1-acyl-sn-glycerol-3-phosphate acyltransferase [Planctomycetota bacterium]|nr:1-acyl-sn-glycerol-3-phosphate acyltransferase [Planctomycetota bacterium]
MRMSSKRLVAPPQVSSGLIYWLSKALLYTCNKVWLRLAVEGAHHVPRTGPVLIVANHASYLDPPVLGCATRRVVQFLAQSGLAKRGLLRWWLQKVGVVLIDRKAPSKDALRFLSEALAQGGCVGLFAEGTRSLDGSVGAFRSGIDFLVRRTGATVIPAGIEGSFRSFPRGAKWPRPAKCTVRLGTPRSAAEVLAPGGVEALRQEVARLANAKLGN